MATGSSRSCSTSSSGRRGVQSGWRESTQRTVKSSFSKPVQTKRAPTKPDRPSPPKLTYKEVQGDLFKCPKEFSMAHCVGADLAMSKGIATIFKDKFGGVSHLKAQGAVTGSVAYLRRNDRYIYYLVTKKRSFDKPTLSSLKSSLEAMRAHCVCNEVSHLAMPKIGSGLDRLDWDQVRELLYEIFGDLEMVITIYYL